MGALPPRLDAQPSYVAGPSPRGASCRAISQASGWPQGSALSYTGPGRGKLSIAGRAHAPQARLRAPLPVRIVASAPAHLSAYTRDEAHRARPEPVVGRGSPFLARGAPAARLFTQRTSPAITRSANACAGLPSVERSEGVAGGTRAALAWSQAPQPWPPVTRALIHTRDSRHYHTEHRYIRGHTLDGAEEGRRGGLARDPQRGRGGHSRDGPFLAPRTPGGAFIHTEGSRLNQPPAACAVARPCAPCGTRMLMLRFRSGATRSPRA